MGEERRAEAVTIRDRFRTPVLRTLNTFQACSTGVQGGQKNSSSR